MEDPNVINGINDNVDTNSQKSNFNSDILESPISDSDYSHTVSI